ncbi:hypothetical protein BC827DRAFT_1156918 [Russula dissimulans]|nr:hypothetical protein BC827DRAFT_1156918 [Russula dissimulans]
MARVESDAEKFFEKYALLHNTARLHSRASPVPKFYPSNFLSAAQHARRDQKPPGLLRRWSDNILPNYIVLGILGPNGIVFATWLYVQLFLAMPYIQVGVPAR